MEELEKPTSSSSKTADDGAYGKRLSPRLHNNVVVHNAGLLLDGCSAQRRFSPRLHKNCPNIGRVSSWKPSSRGSFCPNFDESPPCYPVDSFPEPSVQGTFISKFPESLEHCRPIATSKTITDSETQIPNFPSRDPSFQRRLSPRLNKNPDLSSSSLRQMQRRLSPRLHQTPEEDKPKEPTLHRRLKPGLDSDGKSEKEKPKESAPQRRASPKIHSDAENEKQKPKESAPQRRVSPRLHSDGENETQKHKESAPQRRVSPRLHSDGENETQKHKESAPQRRVSPRLHSDGENEKQKHKDSALQRRVSPRLHGGGENERQKLIPDGSASEKRSFSGFHTKDNFNNAKRSRHDHTKDDGRERSLKPSHSTGNGPAANNELPVELIVGSKVLKKKAKMDGIAPVAAGRSNHAMLKETLRIFNAYYLQFIKEEEVKRKKSKNEEKKSKALKSKEKDVKQTSSRPDLRAVSKMKEKKEILYPDRRIGHIPGIEVGYQFFSRAEMVAIGFHSHWLNGIDYIGQSATKTEEDRHYTFPIAVSIVMSGQYEDDLDNSEDIIYTGEGGHDLVGSKLQHADQVLLRGNLAMKNSMEQSVPVRVVRGHRSANSYSGKIYTYDGLYKVVDTWADKGQRGHLVYKYHLKRMKGQPKLTTNQVHFVRGCRTKTLPELPGLVCHDISNGQEAICIPVTNLFDDALIDEGFTYIKTVEVAEGVNLPPTAAGCACKGNCTNPKTCACAKLNGSDFPYVRRDGGRLVEAKDVVFECGPSCKCGPGCLNRTSQRGIKYHLEVYRTHDKGWAVRSRDFIPSGAPVCEYIGLLRRSDEVDNISGNDYIFEIDCWHTMNEIEGRERRFGNVPLLATTVLKKIADNTLDGTPEFCIDAGSRGNVARFINHSCEPNLFVQCILSAHHDLRLARVVLFAAENISPLQELTYDYGYALDSVIGPDGKVIVLPCFCGTTDCRKRLY